MDGNIFYFNIIFKLRTNIFTDFIYLKQTIIIVAIMLNASNTYGFLKCKYGSEQNMQNVATSFFGKQMFNTVS
jgi:hypothetical protein